ncbi:MAG: hypothetical protein WC330_01010 [Candidatus Omnitrophota bacterium]
MKAKRLYETKGDKEGATRAQDFMNVLSCGSQYKVGVSSQK